MKTTIVYNYSGVSQTVAGYIVPVGGPYQFPIDAISTETGLIINSSGVIEPAVLQADFLEIYEQGFLLGLSVAAMFIFLRLLKMIRGRPAGA